jgi:hypothetical protein
MVSARQLFEGTEENHENIIQQAKIRTEIPSVWSRVANYYDIRSWDIYWTNQATEGMGDILELSLFKKLLRLFLWPIVWLRSSLQYSTTAWSLH